VTDWVPPDRLNSRAVLIGTSRYDELPEVPAAANSLESVHALLTGPLCAWPADRVTLIAEPVSPGDLPDLLVEIFGQARDAALFYYVGHGQVDFEDQLCLGLASSRVQSERRATTSLTFEAVRRALHASPAATKVVILDCCFAGQAVHSNHSLTGGDGTDITGLIAASGAYTLAATGPNSTAWFEADAASPLPLTHFTRALVNTVTRGIPGPQPVLTLEPLYRRLHDVLYSSGKPAPTRNSRDLAGDFIFARNVAVQLMPGSAPEATASGDVAARRSGLLDDAEDAARSIEDAMQQCHALIDIAGISGADDLDRARRILDETGRIADKISDSSDQASLRWAAADAAAKTDPGRARSLFQAFERSISAADITENDRDGLLGLHYRDAAVLLLDPDLTERLAGMITSTRQRGRFLARATEAVAGRDPSRAERLARLAGDEETRGEALNGLIGTVLDDDPDRAERVARGISDPWYRAGCLADVAATVAPYDLERARHLLREAEQALPATDPDLHDRCRRMIVRSLTATSRLDRAAGSPAVIAWIRQQAERIARKISGGETAAEAAMAAAKAMLPDKPDAARSLLDYAARRIGGIKDRWERFEASYTLSEVAAQMITVDTGRAIEIAKSTPMDGPRDRAFSAIVSAIASAEPRKAEDIAHRIADPQHRGPALTAVALAIAETDPAGASMFLDYARRITRGTDAIRVIARRVAAHDPDLAVKVLTEDASGSRRSEGLAGIAETLTAKDPERAAVIARSIHDPFQRYRALSKLAAHYSDAASRQ
jgi:hypothetical protein